MVIENEIWSRDQKKKEEEKVERFLGLVGHVEKSSTSRCGVKDMDTMSPTIPHALGMWTELSRWVGLPRMGILDTSSYRGIEQSYFSHNTSQSWKFKMCTSQLLNIVSTSGISTGKRFKWSKHTFGTLVIQDLSGQTTDFLFFIL